MPGLPRQDNPTGNVQTCGDAELNNFKEQDGKYNETRVALCAAVTDPQECGRTKLDRADGTSDPCVWYFGYKEGACDRVVQHAACQRLTSESACLANPACRPNRDPWYMDAIIHNNPHDGGTLLGINAYVRGWYFCGARPVRAHIIIMCQRVRAYFLGRSELMKLICFIQPQRDPKQAASLQRLFEPKPLPVNFGGFS